MANSISFAKNVHNSNKFRGKITKCKVDSKDCFFYIFLRFNYISNFKVKI